MEQETYKIMEYDRVREMLAGCASSLIGKERAQTMLPTSDFDEAVEWIQQTTEAVTVLATAAPPFGGIFDIRPLLKKAKMGAVLDLDEARDVARALLDAVFQGRSQHVLSEQSKTAVVFNPNGFVIRFGEDRTLRELLIASPAIVRLSQGILRVADRISALIPH